MILDNPEKVVQYVEYGTEELTGFHNELAYIIKNTKYASFSSRVVPGVERAKWIAFSFYGTDVFYTVSYKDSTEFTKLVTQPIEEFVFTPTLLDLNTLTLVNKEDVIERIEKATSK